ncbi:MAG: hypothetical protein AUH28_19980 [Acidobacteria bacterium 13_1_40CM_56_16]|nr:MAG: hypothetical protein AUH28_19980 [Acidobacteria bacterium 13_1_40CM_56_16]
MVFTALSTIIKRHPTPSLGSKKNHITGFVDETQRPQFANLPLVDRRLETEIELIEVLHKG